MDAKKTMKNKLKLYITLGIVGVVILVGSLVALNWEQILRMTSTKEATPIFVFNESEAPDWWAGDSYNAQESVNPEEYQGPEPIDTLPFASINVMKGKKGEYATSCFVMFSYYNYNADISKLKAEKEAGTSSGDMNFKNIGEAQSRIQTIDGMKSFTLTKYELSGPGAENSMKGMSYGWIELKKGYIQVSGVCPTALELDGTLRISEAVSLINNTEI